MATLQEKLVTAQQLATKQIRHSCELDQGRIVRVSPAGRKHGLVLARILRLLVKHVDKKRLGKVLSGETGFWVRRDPDSVRAPDAAFVSHETLERAEDGEGPYFAVAPDLAVEVLSPDDRWVAVDRKVREYLDAGAKAVWVVNPESETVWVFEAGTTPRVLERGGKIDGGSALPGFRSAVKSFFEG
jgi:Uma2 family endonuclease